MEIQKARTLKGELTVPGDKSISHRAVMFGSIADGSTEVTGFLQGADCLSTIDCFRKMGVVIERNEDRVLIRGNGLHGLKAPASILDTGNSGTTTRLISGILAAQAFDSTLTGDESIQSRPMNRIMEPLALMGADIKSRHDNHCAPLLIHGQPLRGIHYQSKIASAQVKSCVLLAGLYAEGTTSVTEPVLSRNHTELMLSAFGADIRSDGLTASVSQCRKLTGQSVPVPGDISSAAYFIAAGLMVPGSEILIRNVGINPTRSGILEVCRSMGGNITLLNERTAGGEPVADLLVQHSHLKGTVIEGDIIPTLIDEIPVIAVMASLAEGTTVIRDAAELKVKETNRIDTVTEGLTAMGADISPADDGMIIHGKEVLHGAEIQSYLDHRIAMAFTVAGLAAEGTTKISGSECADISFPGFYDIIGTLG